MFRESQPLEAQADLKPIEQAFPFPLETALEAYQSKILELRVMGDTGIQHLSKNPSKAEAQIKNLLDQGYVLRQGENGFYLSRGLPGGMMTPIMELERKLDMKQENTLSVFITYQWAQKDIAKAVHKAFEAKGFLVIRDEEILQNNTYIKDFMKVITHPKLDYVLPIVSATYLKSKNCMYEVNQVMKRHDWESSLLPYVVTQDRSADARIYSGVTSYKKHWQEQHAQSEDLEDKEIFENIIKNIGPFTTAIATRINVPETELVASGYEPLFEIVHKRESAREGVKFKAIEELLRVASTSEKKKRYDKAKESFEASIAKLDEMEHLGGIDDISEKAYRLYGEYLLRQGDQEAAKHHLEIAENFKSATETPNADMARLSLESSPAKVVTPQVVSRSVPLAPRPASSSSPSSLVTPGSNQNVLMFRSAPKPSKAVTGPVVNPQEHAQFLSYVAQGEQAKAEAMLKQNPDLGCVAGTVTDLSKRTFEGITGFQYAVWALDWHMWKMLLKYLPMDEAKRQAEQMDSGPWVRTHGLDAGPHLHRLMDALKTYIDNFDAWYKKDKSYNKTIEQHWCKQVGGAQLLLPAHVLNEYCHPDRPFDPCPNFEEERELPRSRKVYIDKWYDDVLTATWNNGSLGNTFGLYRGVQVWGACGWTSVRPAWEVACIEGATADRLSITTLCSTRTQQRDRLIGELCNRSIAEPTRHKAGM